MREIYPGELQTRRRSLALALFTLLLCIGGLGYIVAQLW